MISPLKAGRRWIGRIVAPFLPGHLRDRWDELPRIKTSIIAHTSLDQSVYQGLRATSEAWKDTEYRHREKCPFIRYLMADIFYSLYRHDVNFTSDFDPLLYWNYIILHTTAENLEYRTLRGFTVADPINAALATLYLTDHLVRRHSMVPEVRRTLKHALHHLHRAGHLAAVTDILAEKPQSKMARLVLSLLARGPRGDDPAQMKGWRTKIQEAATETIDLQYDVAHALQDTHKDLQDVAGLRANWDLFEESLESAELDQINEIVSAVRHLAYFRELTDILGRFQHLADLKKKRLHRTRKQSVLPRRITGLKTGRDLENLAPIELVKLADKDMEDMFYEGYDNKRLLHYVLKGDHEEARGPIVCCMDTSSSMGTVAARELKRFVWAKGLGLALLHVAQDQDRPFLGICFSSEDHIASFSLDSQARDGKKVLDMLKCDFHAGTNFEAPLTTALESLEKSTWRQADIVFITDGEATLSDDFVRRFRQEHAAKGFKMFTIFIGGYHEGLAALSNESYVVEGETVDSWENVFNKILPRINPTS